MLNLNISELSGGAVLEKINQELEKVILNIADPNTDAKKKRKLKLELTFAPDASRQASQLSCLVTSTLAPFEPIETALSIGVHPKTGECACVELVQGNLFEEAKVTELTISKAKGI